MTIARRGALALAAGLALSAALGTGAAAQEVTLRLHQFLPAQANVPAHVLDKWIADVEEASDGRIEVQHFPAMQLGGTPPQLYDQVVDGVADIIWTVAGYTPGRFPRAEVFELPFMIDDAGAGSRAYWRYAEENMFDTDFSDVKVLGTWVHGPGVIHSDVPIESIEDLAGLKLRAPTRTSNTLLANLGAEPVGLPVPAIPESLSKGVIDGAVVPWEVTSSLRLTELVGNHTEFGEESIYNTAFVFAMNLDRWNSLPEDLQQIIMDQSGEEFSAFAGAQMREDDADARQIAVDAGNNIIALTPEQVDDWREASQSTIDSWVAEMDEAGLDGTALLAQARGLIEEASAE